MDLEETADYNRFLFPEVCALETGMCLATNLSASLKKTAYPSPRRPAGALFRDRPRTSQASEALMRDQEPEQYAGGL